MCDLGLLGLCNFDYSSCFNKLVDTHYLTESFVDEFAKMFIPALEKYMKAEGKNYHGNHGHLDKH